jgi:RimJ/RimL family protein N-acetyltransferase
MSILRDVLESDLPVFFEHQRDPEATRMAAFPARDEEAFMAHWRKILADDAGTTKTIVFEGEVAGNAVAFDLDGRRHVGYWLGREFWGKGLATKAVTELLEVETTRPIYADVATSNVGSVRVLEKCGFTLVSREVEHDERLGEEIEVALYELS